MLQILLEIVQSVTQMFKFYHFLIPPKFIKKNLSLIN
nr:MAG TPA: hypothetical protein [Caudoviricetes sp.]